MMPLEIELVCAANPGRVVRPGEAHMGITSQLSSVGLLTALFARSL